MGADNARVRQRLANTLFAQIFAGSPREREGALGWLLNAMAWFTLAIAPILILLTFQFMFLPYHSHLATWMHRLLILMEFTLAFQLWPLVLNPQRDFQWPDWRWRLRETSLHLRGLIWPPRGRRQALQGLRRQMVPLAAAVVFAFLSLLLASFPGEPHVNLATGNAWGDVLCTRWFAQGFDRLDLPHVDVVDDEKFARLAATGRLVPFNSERTRNFRDRNLNCGDLSHADLRRVDLTRARLSGATLNGARLNGATLDEALLQGASLIGAQLQSASMVQAQLQGANLSLAQLQGANAEGARLQAAKLQEAALHGASLISAMLQGADFQAAKIEGTRLDEVHAQYATFRLVVMRGVSLNRAHLQHAIVANSFKRVLIIGSYLFGATGALDCDGALVIAPNTGDFVEARVLSEGPSTIDQFADAVREFFGRPSKPRLVNTVFQYTGASSRPDEIEAWIDTVAAELPPNKRADFREKVRSKRGSAVDWTACSRKPETMDDEQEQKGLAALLLEIACQSRADREHIAHGMIRNWLMRRAPGYIFSAEFSKGLLEDKSCGANADLDESTKLLLRDIAAEVFRG